MPKIKLDNVSLDIPIYDPVSRSLTRSLTRNIPVGGKIKRESGKRTSILALDSVTMELNKGDKVALLGHNGAGKTSMLKLLAGFYEPTSGKIIREGKIAALLDLMAGMDGNLSGYSNILLCGMLHGLQRSEVLSRVDEIAEFSELGSYLDMPVRLYSQGMMLRLAFSICTTIDCDILLLDEWVAAGDQAFIEKAKARLDDLVFRTSILVFATHNPDAALQLCNQAAYFEHGNLLMYGDINDVINFRADR